MSSIRSLGDYKIEDYRSEEIEALASEDIGQEME